MMTNYLVYKHEDTEYPEVLLEKVLSLCFRLLGATA